MKPTARMQSATYEVRAMGLAAAFLTHNDELIPQFIEWARKQHIEANDGVPCGNSDCGYENPDPKHWIETFNDCVEFVNEYTEFVRTVTNN